jgi:serine/threonine protein kinase
MAHESTSETLLIAGRYELCEILGRGSMGTVHRARDVVLDRPVAVKLLPTDATDPSSAARFEQEAKLLARLSHAGLVVVFDAGIDAAAADDPRPYLVMELVPGRTLADRIATGPLDAADTATIASQLASALAYIHRRGIVHRDIKPANILLAGDDETGTGECAKLTDFGIARLVDGTRMTMTGHTLGTANYLSPEQISGGEVTPASDIYSLGLVLLECLTGTVGYPGRGVEAALARLHRQPSIPESLPDGWIRLLGAMTDRDPLGRPGAAEIGVAVTGLADAPNPEATPTTVIRVDPGPDQQPPAPQHAAHLVDESPAATRILPVLEPTAAAPKQRRRRPHIPAAWIGGVLAALAIAVIVVVAVLANSGPGITTKPAPSYPNVSGPLGAHLRQLQQDVAP